MLRFFIPVAAVAALFVCGSPSKADNFTTERGHVFSFLGSSDGGKATTMAIISRYIVINGGTDDEIIADLGQRDIFAQGPDGRPVSMRGMITQFTSSGSTTGTATGGTSPGASGGADPDKEFEALFSDMPVGLKAQLRQQFEKIPRADAIKALKVLRGQMDLPPISVDQVPTTAKSSLVETGKTDTLDGIDVKEVVLNDDRIWVAKTSAVENGQVFVDGMLAFSQLYRDITKGFPVDDSAIMRIGELDGFPIRILTKDGEDIRYQSVEEQDVKIRW